MNPTTAGAEKDSAVAENAPKEPTLPRKQQRTKEQRGKEGAALKSTIANEINVPASADPPEKPLSKRRLAIIHDTRKPTVTGKEVATPKTTNAVHVAIHPTTIKESQPQNENGENNVDDGKSTTDEEDNDTPVKEKGVLKRDLSTPSSASQDSFCDTSR